MQSRATRYNLMPYDLMKSNAIRLEVALPHTILCNGIQCDVMHYIMIYYAMSGNILQPNAI